MTRINLVPPEELTDQHLVAEFREIKMVPKSLARSIRARGVLGVLEMIPKNFTLGKGHVSFFYDKGLYLNCRYHQLCHELLKRGYTIDETSQFDPDGTFGGILSTPLNKDYEPTPEALAIIRARIAEKIAMKPSWYRYEGKPLAAIKR